MKTVFALFTLSSLLLFSGTALARKDPGDYWKNVMEMESMPEVLQILVNGKSSRNNNGDNFVKENIPGSGEHKDKDLNVDKWSNSAILYFRYDGPQTGNTELKDKSSNDNLNHFAPKNKDLNVDKWSNSAIFYQSNGRPQI